MNDMPAPSQPDFLARMVDKALGVGATVEPRVPSLFEPPHRAMVRVDTGWSDEEGRVAEKREECDRLPAGTTPAADAAFLAPQGKRDATRARHGPKPRDQTTTALPFGLSGSMRAAQERDAQGSNSDAVDEQTAARPHVRMGKPPGRVWDGGESEGLRSSPVDHERLSATSALSRRSPVLGEASDKPNETPKRDADGAGRGVLVQDAQASRPTIVIAPPSVVYRSRSGEARSEQAPAKAMPVVNVTIGRIEVRAVQAPGTGTNARPEKRDPPPMNLDEYLKRRGGER
jgi:hypothetical protein